MRHALTAIAFSILLAAAPAQSGPSVVTVGRGCCSGESPPTLDVDPIRGGAAVHVSGTGAPIGEDGLLFWSPPPPAPLPLGGGGCRLHLDPTALVLLEPLRTGPRGCFGLDLLLPPVLTHGPGRIVLQGAIRDPGMSFGWALTDAVAVGR